MKKAILFIVFLFAAANSFAQSSVYVQGYTKSNGTYVASHYRTAPNNSLLDNYSTRGNYNPYTGNYGTRDVYSSSSNVLLSGSNLSSLLDSPSSRSTDFYNTTYSTPSYNYNNYATEYKPVYVGPRGGTYYINSNGNKTYFK